MPELTFRFEGIEPVSHAAVPMLAAKLRIESQPPHESIHTIILRCQVQIEPARRRYTGAEQEKLHDIFDEPSRWARTLRSLLWMNTSITVPAFAGVTLIDLQLPCTFDFNVAATKYFNALESEEVPVTVMFSGTVFYADARANLQATQIPWDKEASFRLPVPVWRRMMDAYYPNSAWLCLQRDVFERLQAYKTRNGLPTFEHTLEQLLEQQSPASAETAEMKP